MQILNKKSLASEKKKKNLELDIRLISLYRCGYWFWMCLYLIRQWWWSYEQPSIHMHNRAKIQFHEHLIYVMCTELDISELITRLQVIVTVWIYRSCGMGKLNVSWSHYVLVKLSLWASWIVHGACLIHTEVTSTSVL